MKIDDLMLILDANPKTKGHSLLIPKEHFESALIRKHLFILKELLN